MSVSPTVQAKRVGREFKQYLPWRVQRALSPSFYVEFATKALFRKVLSTRPLQTGDGTVEVLSLLDRRNLENYLIAIKSLLLHSPVPLAVTVLSDGTLGNQDRELLLEHIRGIRVLEKKDINIPSAYAEAIAAWCKGYPHLAKLMYLPFASRKPLLLFIDSDITFRCPLCPSFFSLPAGVAATFNCDHDHRLYDPKFHYVERYASERDINLISNLNCGLMLWDAARLSPLECLGFLQYLLELDGYLHPVAEQDAWSLLASQVRALPLPDEYLVLSNWDKNDAEHRRSAITMHYVSGERYRRLDYLRDGSRTIRLLHRAPATDGFRGVPDGEGQQQANRAT